MAASTLDIAREAGVHERTVRRALGGKGPVAPETKARILKIAADLNYRPNKIARSLVSGNSGLIGLMIGPGGAEIGNWHTESLCDMTRRTGYALLVHTALGGAEGERRCIDEMICNRVSGVIAQPTHLSDPEPYRQLLLAGIPLVVIDGVFDDLETPQVASNQYLMGRQPTEYLISLGHRRIVHLAIPGTHHIARERARGFREAMSDAGLPIDESSIVPVGWELKDGADTMLELLNRDRNRPTAVVVRHDRPAVGAMAAAMKAGVSIPGDLSITGVGNILLTDMLEVPLTTVVHPSSLIVETASQMLLDMLGGRRVESGIRCIDEVPLIKRESCAPPRPTHR